MSTKEQLLAELDRAPEVIVQEVYDFLGYLQQKNQVDKHGALAVAETSLKKDWLSAEEDKAWQDL